MYHHSKSVIGQFFDWHESPFKWQTRNTRRHSVHRFKEDIFEPPPKPKPLLPPKPPPLQKIEIRKNSFDEKVIRVNPIKFPAQYLEPSRNHIPTGISSLPRTPPTESKVPMNFIPSGKKLARTPPILQKSKSAENLQDIPSFKTELDVWNQRKINSQKKLPENLESPLLKSPYAGEQSFSRRGSRDSIKVPKNPVIQENVTRGRHYHRSSTIPETDIRGRSVPREKVPLKPVVQENVTRGLDHPKTSIIPEIDTRGRSVQRVELPIGRRHSISYEPSIASNEQRRQSIKTTKIPNLEEKSSSKIPIPVKNSREIAIQTGGIMTVRQKSNQNFIPTGSQLRRSPRTPLRTPKYTRSEPKMDVDIEVHHDDDTISQVNYQGTKRISLHFTPNKFDFLRKSSHKKEQEEIQSEKKELKRLIRKISRASSKIDTGKENPVKSTLPKLEPTEKKVSTTKEPLPQLQPIKTTSQGVLLVMVKN